MKVLKAEKNYRYAEATALASLMLGNNKIHASRLMGSQTGYFSNESEEELKSLDEVKEVKKAANSCIHETKIKASSPIPLLGNAEEGEKSGNSVMIILGAQNHCGPMHA